MSELARQIIAENKKTRHKTLDLGNCSLTELPADFTKNKTGQRGDFATGQDPKCGIGISGRADFAPGI